MAQADLQTNPTEAETTLQISRVASVVITGILS